MTGAQILDAILDGAFGTDKRASALTWANRKLGEMWDAAEWTFVETAVNVTVTAGSMSVSSLPTDLGVIVGLHRADGCPLKPYTEYRRFAARYIYTGAPTALPQAFTVIDGGVLVGPASSETSAVYRLIHERALTLLADDSNAPLIPAAYHLALVAGARGLGYELSAPDVAQRYETEFQAAITAMRKRYLVAIRGSGRQLGSGRPC